MPNEIWSVRSWLESSLWASIQQGIFCPGREVFSENGDSHECVAKLSSEFCSLVCFADLGLAVMALGECRIDSDEVPVIFILML